MEAGERGMKIDGSKQEDQAEGQIQGQELPQHLQHHLLKSLSLCSVVGVEVVIEPMPTTVVSVQSNR